VGTQYRSIILYHSEDQRRLAEEVIREVEGKLGRRVVTEVVPFTVFYEAEDYHHSFYDRNRNYPYCRVVIDPKIKKFLKYFPERIKM